MNLEVRDLGRMSYTEAYAIQKDVQQAVISRRSDAGGDGDGGGMTILLVEHDPPVITISRRPGAKKHLIGTESQLKIAGVEVAETDRGGDITYHGPGQLVVYPILDLNRLNLRLNSYLRFLEQIAIDVLGKFGIEGTRDASATGVWVNHKAQGLLSLGPTTKNPTTPTHASKICAIGVRVSRWVSMHGLALNVNTNLDHFNLIVPCGLAGRSVTSIKREFGEQCPSMDEVKATLADVFQKAVLAAAGTARLAVSDSEI